MGQFYKLETVLEATEDEVNPLSFRHKNYITESEKVMPLWKLKLSCGHEGWRSRKGKWLQSSPKKCLCYVCYWFGDESD